ncbi:MAG: hypothetical protein HY538_09255 [Deltaproteobacteria bacterium]|nr:hypothetical protein [Deltaproteobacteria bacterium]
MSIKEKGILWVVRILMVCFAVVGLIFLLFPEGTLRAVNQAGALLGDFHPVVTATNRFWLSLTFAFMVSVTGIAYFIQKDLERYGNLLILLALAKAASSLSCLAFYFTSAHAFVYLLNFAIDGSIALISLICYLLLRQEDNVE